MVELLGFERLDVVPTSKIDYQDLMHKIRQRDESARDHPTETDQDTSRDKVTLARDVPEPEQPLYRRWLLSILNKAINSKRNSDIMRDRSQGRPGPVLQLDEKTDLNDFLGILFQQGQMDLNSLFEGGINKILEFKNKYAELVAKQEKDLRLFEAAKLNFSVRSRTFPIDFGSLRFPNFVFTAKTEPG